MEQSYRVEEFSTEPLMDLLSRGVPKKQIARDLSISVGSLNKTIAELQSGQGLLMQYRELQNLQLTGLQAKVLEAITPEKIECASLVELVTAFRVLKDKELVMTGKANNITGIVGYLVQLEKEEMGSKQVVVADTYESAEDAQLVDSDMPRL